MIRWLKWHITHWLGTNPDTMPMEKLAAKWDEHDIYMMQNPHKLPRCGPFVWYSPPRAGPEIPHPERAVQREKAVQ